MRSLVVIEGPDAGRVLALPDFEPQLIGRSTEALPSADESISRRHAELTPVDGVWWLRDLESTNGTFLNGRLVETRVEVRPGDLIRCGESVFRLDEGVPDATTDDATIAPRRPGPARARDVDAGALDARELLGSPSSLGVVLEVAELLSHAGDRDALLDALADLVWRTLAPRRALVLTTDAEHPDRMPRAERARGGERGGAIVVPRAIVRRVLAQADPLATAAVERDPRFVEDARECGLEGRPLLGFALRTRDRTLGAILLDRAPGDRAFDESETMLARLIGLQAGLALEHAELVGDAVRRGRLATMGETVATLSHSIKNILQGLRGGGDAVALALRRGDVETARKGWPIVQRNLDRILALVLNMLAFARERALEVEFVAPGPLLEEVVDLMRPAAETRRVRLEAVVDDDVPPIPMDAAGMHQVLVNLVGNAIDAAPPKRGRVTLRARFDAERGQLRVEVEDDGAGIDPSVRDRLFEPFVSTKGQRGTGLGLAVSRRIVERHGGRLECARTDERGTVMSITLPGERADADADRTRAGRVEDAGDDAIEWDPPIEL